MSNRNQIYLQQLKNPFDRGRPLGSPYFIGWRNKVIGYLKKQDKLWVWVVASRSLGIRGRTSSRPRAYKKAFRDLDRYIAKQLIRNGGWKRTTWKPKRFKKL